MADEEIKLLLRVQGQAEAASLEKEMAKLRTQILTLGQTASNTDPMMIALAGRLKGMEADTSRLERQFGRAGSGMAGFGQAGMQAGRVLQDFTQGGIGGILNNLEGMTMALGGGPGMAGLLTAVGVAAFIAKPYLASLFGDGAVKAGADALKTTVENLQDRIKELNDKPIKFAEDRNELAALARDMKMLADARKAYDGAAGYKSKSERASESGTAEAIGEGGALKPLRDAMVAKATASLAARQADRDAKLAEAIDDAYAGDEASGVAPAMEEVLRKKHKLASDTDSRNTFQNVNNEVGKLLAPADVANGETVEGKHAQQVAAMKAAGADEATVANMEAKSPDRMKEEAHQKAQHEAEKKQAETMTKIVTAEEKLKKDNLDYAARQLDLELKKRHAGLDYDAKMIADGLEEKKEGAEHESKLTTQELKEKKTHLEYESRELDRFLKKRAEGLEYEKHVKQIALGLARQETADFAAKHDGRTPEQEYHRLQGRQAQRRNASQEAANGLMDRTAAASGLGDPIAELMWRARQHTAMRQRGGDGGFQEKLKGKSQKKRLEIIKADRAAREEAGLAKVIGGKAVKPERGPMTFEQREAAQTQSNEATDRQLEDMVTRSLLGQDGKMVRGRRMRGSRAVTRDEGFARQTAKDMVMRARKEQDSQTGDQPVETKKNSEALAKLTERLDRGVKVILD